MEGWGCRTAPSATSRLLSEDSPVEGSRVLDFDYLEKFMAECFMASGTPEKDRDEFFQ